MHVRLRRDALKEYIYRKNMSQNQFANKAKVSKAFLAQILSGKRNPSGDVRAKILKATGLEFDALFIIERSNDLNIGASN